jgi:hypothetical protein
LYKQTLLLIEGAWPMGTECSATQLAFEGFEGRQVVGAFDGGAVTSNGGAPLLREADLAMGLTAKVARCFRDVRNPAFVVHQLETLVAQRIHGLALGYEDLNDHDELRCDPALGLLSDTLEPKRDDAETLAGKSTLNRLEHGPLKGASRYHKISVDDAAMEQVFIDLSGPRAAAALRAHDAGFLLRLAHVQNAFGLLELAQVGLCDVVLALALLESNEIDAFGSDEALDVADERLAHRRHRRRRGEPLAPVHPQVAHRGPHRLQVRHIDVEVHPIDRLVLKHHMITQHVRHGSCYRHCGLRSSTGPRTHRASSSHIQGMSLQARPESTQVDRVSTNIFASRCGDISRRSEAKPR